MQIIKDRNGYHIENDLGHPVRNSMGDVVYYESIPFEFILYPTVDKTSSSPFSNPMIFDPFKRPNY